MINEPKIVFQLKDDEFGDIIIQIKDHKYEVVVELIEAGRVFESMGSFETYKQAVSCVVDCLKANLDHGNYD